MPAAESTSADLLAANMPLNTSTSLSRVPQRRDIMPRFLLLHALHCNKDHHGNTTDFLFYLFFFQLTFSAHDADWFQVLGERRGS